MRTPDTFCDQGRDVDSLDHAVGFFNPSGLVDGVGELRENARLSLCYILKMGSLITYHQFCNGEVLKRLHCHVG